MPAIIRWYRRRQSPRRWTSRATRSVAKANEGRGGGAPHAKRLDRHLAQGDLGGDELPSPELLTPGIPRN
jgi:hypothetical protein